MEIPKAQQRRSRNRPGASSNVSFDSFLFVDNVTNSRIVLKEARRHYQAGSPPSQHKLEQEKELNSLSECLSTLKSTKLFQMDSLRSKLFKSAHHGKAASSAGLQETKRGLRVLIEASINELSMRELRECFSDPHHRIDARIIALQSLSGHKLTKENIEALLSSKDAKDGQAGLRKADRGQLVDASFELKEEKELLEQANNYLQNNLRANSSHLVKPKYQRELYEKLYSACSGKKVPKKAAHPASRSMDCEGVFKPIERGAAGKEAEKRIARGTVRGEKKERKEILFAVENGLFFDVEMLVSMDKELAHAQDAQGNNLLHIAAKNRNEELFGFILRRTGPQDLAARNNVTARLLSSAERPSTSPGSTAPQPSCGCARTTRPTPTAEVLPLLRDYIS